MNESGRDNEREIEGKRKGVKENERDAGRETGARVRSKSLWGFSGPCLPACLPASD